MKQINLKVPERLYNRLERRAAESYVSVQEYIRELVRREVGE